MYNVDDSGVKTGLRASDQGGLYYNRDKNTIRKALEEAGYEAEQIKKAFEDIAEIAIDAKQSELTKVQSINKYLTDVYGLKGLGVSAIRPFVRMAEESLSEFSGASQTSTRMAKSDSTPNNILFDKFQKDSLLVKQALDAKEITDKEYQDKMFSLVSDLEARVDRTALSFDQKDLLSELGKMYQAPNTASGGAGSSGGGGKGSTAKTPTDLMKEALTGYSKSAQELKNRLEAGAITQNDFKQSLDELNDKTWQSITAFDNFQDILGKMPAELQDTATEIGESFAQNLTEKAQKQINQQLDKLYKDVFTVEGSRDTSFDYMHDSQAGPGQTFSPLQRHQMQGQLDVTLDYSDALKSLIDKLKEGIENGDFDLVKDAAIEQLGRLEDEFAKAKNEATSFQHVLNFAEAQEQLADLQEQLKETTINGVEELARSFGSVNGALFDIIELFDEDVKDSEFYKGLEAMMTVMNSLITIFQTFQGVIEAVGTAKKLLAQISKQTAAQEVAADLAVASAEGTKAAASAGAAAAGAGSSVASVPIVGPILAVAAIGTVVAAILAAMSKFATGGIVGGNSMTGDHNVVRANSGEMILTKGQQATLFNAIQSGNLGGGGNVEFKIRGADLIGVMENTHSRRRG